MLAGMFLAIVSYRPLFNQLLNVTDITNSAELSDKKEINKKITPTADGQMVMVTTTKRYFENGNSQIEMKTDTVNTAASLNSQVKLSKQLGQSAYWKIVGIIFIMILYVTMVYGPIAAFLVELFPTRIRYTSMSLPYHIGNGIFGGLTPFIATLLTTIYIDNKLVGLWYPIIVGGICFIIGMVYINNKIDPDVND